MRTGPPVPGTAETPVDLWRPARLYPQTYPGDCPPGGYVLRGDTVHPLVSTGEGDLAALAGDHWRPLDDFLAERGDAPLAERVPVLAYGANRNPATLRIKLDNYGGAGSVPVLAGFLPGADVVACGLHGHGYLYGELVLDAEVVGRTALDVRVLLLDDDQLRVMNDSEGLRSGMYSLAVVEGVIVHGVTDSVAPLAYLAGERAWVSPQLGSPIAYSEIHAKGRQLPAMSGSEILEHVLEVLDLGGEVCAATGIDREDLLEELPKYLNGQWWYAFHTGDRPVAGYRRVLDLFAEAMAASCAPVRTLDRLRPRGALLDPAAAYSPDATHRWDAALSEAHVLARTSRDRR